MCCKPDVDAECDWLCKLVAVDLWDAVFISDPLPDANFFVFVDIYDESFTSGLAWYYRNADIDTGGVAEPIPLAHCIADLVFDSDDDSECLGYHISISDSADYSLIHAHGKFDVDPNIDSDCHSNPDTHPDSHCDV